jgi:hypothetical protein
MPPPLTVPLPVPPPVTASAFSFRKFAVTFFAVDMESEHGALVHDPVQLMKLEPAAAVGITVAVTVSAKLAVQVPLVTPTVIVHANVDVGWVAIVPVPVPVPPTVSAYVRRNPAMTGQAFVIVNVAALVHDPLKPVKIDPLCAV